LPNPNSQPSAGQSGKPSEESSHPTLRRGRPTQPLPDDDLRKNDQSKPANDATTKGSSAGKKSGGAKEADAKNAAKWGPQPYMDKQIPNDPWERPYQYMSPGKKNTTSFDVWSFGPDGNDGTADDIGNW